MALTEESERLYVGQSHDLHWTANLMCPSIGQYIRALDDSEFVASTKRTSTESNHSTETGGLIRMLARLLEVVSPLAHRPNVHPLVTMLGRAYALRDDYMNLSSTKVILNPPPPAVNMGADNVWQM